VQPVRLEGARPGEPREQPAGELGAGDDVDPVDVDRSKSGSTAVIGRGPSRFRSSRAC
jgi:hypothetical protein